MLLFLHEVDKEMNMPRRPRNTREGPVRITVAFFLRYLARTILRIVRELSDLVVKVLSTLVARFILVTTVALIIELPVVTESLSKSLMQAVVAAIL